MAIARPQCDGEVEALAKALDMDFPDGMNYDEDMARAKVRPQLIKLQAAKLQQLRALHCSLAFKREHVEPALTIVAARRQADWRQTDKQRSDFISVVARRWCVLLCHVSRAQLKQKPQWLQGLWQAGIRQSTLPFHRGPASSISSQTPGSPQPGNSTTAGGPAESAVADAYFPLVGMKSSGRHGELRFPLHIRKSSLQSSLRKRRTSTRSSPCGQTAWQDPCRR